MHIFDKVIRSEKITETDARNGMLIRLFLALILLLVHLQKKLLGTVLARLFIRLRQATRGHDCGAQYPTADHPKIASIAILLPGQRGPFRSVHGRLTLILLSGGTLLGHLSRVIRARPRRINRCRALLVILVILILVEDGLEEPASPSLFVGDFGRA